MASLADCRTSASSKEEIDCPDSEEDCDDYSPKSDWDTDIDDDDGPFDMETTCPGQRFSKEEEEKIKHKWQEEYVDLFGEFSRLYNEFLEDEDADYSLPPMPLKELPVTTYSCINKTYCYHREYMTNDTHETSQTLGFQEPKDMLQFFSLRLSHVESYPICVYGIFAVRDDLEPLRNYVFNRTRDDPVVIEKDSFALPLCSPCRGMYVLGRALLEVDLWIKKDGDRSNDEQLLSAFAEIELRSTWDAKLARRIHGDHCWLDMSYMFLADSVEATIEVSALADNPCHVKFIAFSSSYDEITLFKGKAIMKGELIRHVVAVKAKEKLSVRLELGDSVFEWTFQDGSADDLIMNQFHVRVFFAPKTPPLTGSRYYDWKIRCKKVESIQC